MVRRGLLATADLELERTQRERKGKAGRYYAPLDPPSEAPALPELSFREALRQEREMLGFYITGHPLDYLSRDIEQGASTSADVRDGVDGRKLTLVGLVLDVEKKSIRNNNTMAKFSVEDSSGRCLAHAFGQVAEGAFDGALARLFGQIVVRDEQPEFRVKKADLLEEW
ncbi:hypothetical protein EF847_01450 [Actinobacteria bacterium YIM 96077]|uniref:DNA polymerase III subunit alpha n=1 Tax=Phytoactinopolyspora halophila TaxID=1981511 RepID=A0A329QIH8_9ACTN|nr:hypothetical protein [Phytoactinopolyspora halophila]AYY11586.1 hypothetical protein EF847_01450 [Actinobacteria bacterium YIM 96077]RAW11132.1 hypothetical protein DPM12_17475 [Phytoactinopolyspora halophila]